MARKKVLLSVGIRLGFIVTLSLTWHHHSVVAVGELDPSLDLFKGATPKNFDDSKLTQLPKDILANIFDARHESQASKILQKGQTALNTNEQLVKQYFEHPKFNKDGKELTNLQVRERLINEMYSTQKDFQTIAVGVDPKAKTVVVAGNIKDLDFDNVNVIVKKRFASMNPIVKSVGFHESDYSVIKKTVQEVYPGYGIEVVSPSETDLKRAIDLEGKRQEPKTPAAHDIKNAQAHVFHAEMQIKKHFENIPEGTKVVASKQYCVKCRDNLPPEAKVGIPGESYDGSRMRWEMPENVQSHHISDPVPASQLDIEDLETKIRRESVSSLESSGGSCSSKGGRRRRRSLCTSFKDVTEVDADTFRQKLADIPEGDRANLLSSLDQVGMGKLKGSELARTDIRSKWKKWKSSVVKGVVGALKGGTILSKLTGNKFMQLSKTAISPKLLTKSLDRAHAKKIKSISKEYKRATSGESFKGFGMSYKVVKAVSLGMIGKNLIGGMLNGDVESLATMGGLLAVDKLLEKGGEKMAAHGIKLAQAGRTATGAALKVAGPIVGAATSAFSIYGLVGNVNRLDSLKKMCEKKDNLFQERFEKDCKYDTDTAIANVVGDVIGIVSTVATVAKTILKLFSVATGPLGIVAAVVDVLVAIGTQIYAAIQAVAKISSSLVGGLTGSEKFHTGFRAFFGIKPPAHIQRLLDIKKSYNLIVAQAVTMLKYTDNFQTYVLPTNHTRSGIDHNCRYENRPTDAGRVIAGILSLGLSEIAMTEPIRKCDTLQEFEEDNEADFQNWQQLRQFRVEPDTPSWGRLECKPNSLPGRNYPDDPQYVGYTNGYLCHNLIAMTAPDRQHLPALIDLKNGSDFFLGFPNRKHIFVVGAGSKNFTGGSADDVFVLKFFPLTGSLDGAGGTNTLVLDAPWTDRTRIDFSNVSCPQFTNCASHLKNFQQIIGRTQMPDSLVTACSLTYLDLNGGQSLTDQDEITIPAAGCNTTLIVQLRSFTKLNNLHEANGEFTYQVEFAAGVQVNLDPEKNMHRLVFTNDIVTANLSYESGYLFVIDENDHKNFMCNYIKSTTSTFLLTTQAGLSINFDQDSDSFYGLVPPSSNEYGVQKMKGLVNHPNRFIISTNNVTLNLTGGDKEDIFSLSGPIWPTGSIDGGLGFDSIIMQNDFRPEEPVTIDYISKILSPGELKILSIETIIGRPNLSEVVVGSCDLNWVDLGGGSDNDSDVLQFSSQLSCSSEMTLMVRRFTTVENLASSGYFNYQIQLETLKPQTNFIQVDMDASSATYTYIFLKSGSSVSEILFDQVTNKFEVHFDNESWVGTIPLERATIYMESQLLVQLLPHVQGIVRVQSDTSGTVYTGLRTYPNAFVLGMTTRESSFIGGEEDDAFFITSEKFQGNLNGGAGTNALFFTDTLWDEQLAIFNVANNSLALKIGNETEQQLRFSNIHRFFGREEQADIVLPGCDTQLVDTKGGRTGSPVSYDLVHISSMPDCYFFLDVAIRANLIILNDAMEGDFKYEGDFRGGSNTSIFLTFSPNSDHKVYLDMDFTQLNSLTLDEGRVNMTAMDETQFSVDFFIPDEADTHTQPSISFQDGLELKVSQNGPVTATLFGTLRNVSPSDLNELEGNIEESQLIRRYRRAAKDTRTSVMMQAEDDKLVSIGSGGIIDVLTALPGYPKNILVCNDANETIYRIANGSSTVQILFNLKFSGPKLLDLTPIVNEDPEIFPKILVVHGTDLLIQIKEVEITIKGLAAPTYEFLPSWQVILRETFLNIEEEFGIYKLVAQPIVVNSKEFDSFVVDTHSLEYDMKFLTTSNNDSQPIKYEGVKQGDNLVFTNLFQQDSSEEVASVIFYDFYNEKEPEALYAKRVIFEVEEGVVVNVTMETAENLPTFEQREWEAFGKLNPLVFIVPVLAAFLVGSIALLCWFKKWYRYIMICGRRYQLVDTKTEKPLIPGTRLLTAGKVTEYELIPTIFPEEPSMNIDHGTSYKILSDRPPKFPMIEKSLPIFQGLLRLQNFNVSDRYCGSSIECLEGVIPLPHIVVQTLFSPQADCIRVEKNEKDFTVALPTESVSNVASVLFILCLRRRPVVARTEQGEIVPGIRRIMQVLRPACAEFIEQERNPPQELIGAAEYLSPRFLRFVLHMERMKYQAAVNVDSRFRHEPESALSSLDELRMRIQRKSTPFQPVPVVNMEEELEGACQEVLNKTI